MFDIWNHEEALAEEQYQNENYLIRTTSKMSGGGIA